MTTKTTKFNPFDYFDTLEEQREFIQEAWDDEDPEVFKLALGHLTRYHGVADIAKKMGVSRTSLYKSISGKVEPKIGTIKQILKATEVNLQFVTDMKVQFAAT
jgi:probable addiction module antidote protein